MPHDKDNLIAQLINATQAHNAAHSCKALQANNQHYMACAKVPYYFSNELDVEFVQERLTMAKPRKSPDCVNIAVLTGEAHLLSRLPELVRHTDVILIADLEPLIHQHVTFMLQVMRACETPQAFWTRYLNERQNPVLLAGLKPIIPDEGFKVTGQVKIHAGFLAVDIKSKMANLGGWHFLNSLTRYQQCREALSKCTILPLHWDWLDVALARSFMARLSEVAFSVEFCHFSNVLEYVSDSDAGSRISPLTSHTHKSVFQVLAQFCANSPDCIMSFASRRRETGALHSALAIGVTACQRYWQLQDADWKQYSLVCHTPAQQTLSALTDYDYTRPLYTQSSTARLNDWVQENLAISDKFIAYWSCGQSSRVDAVCLLTDDKSNYVMTALQSAGIHAQTKVVPGHVYLIVPGVNETGLNGNADNISRLRTTPASHNLTLVNHYHQMMTVVLDVLFYSLLSLDKIHQIKQTLQVAKQHPRYNSRIAHYIDLVNAVLKWVIASPLGMRSATDVVPAYVFPPDNGRLFCEIAENETVMFHMVTLTDRIFQGLNNTHPIPNIPDKIALTHDTSAGDNVTQTESLLALRRLLQRIMAKHPDMPELDWQPCDLAECPMSLRTSTCFANREYVVSLARHIKSQGCDAVLLRENASFGPTYRVMIRSMSTHLMRLQANTLPIALI